VFLEDARTPECQGIVNTAGMANGIVHNNEGIRKGDKLVNGQNVIA